MQKRGIWICEKYQKHKVYKGFCDFMMISWASPKCIVFIRIFKLFQQFGASECSSSAPDGSGPGLSHAGGAEGKPPQVDTSAATERFRESRFRAFRNSENRFRGAS